MVGYRKAHKSQGMSLGIAQNGFGHNYVSKPVLGLNRNVVGEYDVKLSYRPSKFS